MRKIRSHRQRESSAKVIFGTKMIVNQLDCTPTQTRTKKIKNLIKIDN